MLYILNAFSLNMLKEFPSSVYIKEVSEALAQDLAVKGESAVGHSDTAAVFTTVLGVPVAFNRANVILQKGDLALIGQYRGPRLLEGATNLPEGATISWYLAQVG